MTAALRLVEEPVGRPTTREAVEDLLADSRGWWATFEASARDGVIALRGSVLEFREALQTRGHAFDSHDEQFEEVFGALLGLAEECFPDSPGAARGRLRERVRDDVRPRPDGGVRIEGDVPVRRAVEVVLAFEDWLFDEFVLAAGYGYARLYAAARRVRGAVARTGREYPVEEVEDELWCLVREVAPNSLAARPDTERLEDLRRRAQAYVEEHDPRGALGEVARQEHEDRTLEAARDHDPPVYRAALRELCQAARDAARGRERTDGDEGDGDEG